MNCGLIYGFHKGDEKILYVGQTWIGDAYTKRKLAHKKRHDDIQFKVLESDIPKKDLDKRERFWIDELKPVLNTNTKNAYEAATVYILRHPSFPTVAYIGQTVKPLSERFSNHRSEAKLRPHSKRAFFFNQAGWDEAVIEPLWTGPFEDKDQKEAEFMQQYAKTHTLLNQFPKYSTAEEKTETRRKRCMDYYTNNRDAVRENMRSYYKKQRQDPEFVERERERGREKYHRLYSNRNDVN